MMTLQSSPEWRSSSDSHHSDEFRAESTRFGGVPVFAVLAGLGWQRTGDALGPVIQATDGRTFTLSTLDEMLTVQPLPALQGLATG